MKIQVNGIAKKFVPPNEIILNIFFTQKGKTYQEAVSKGLNNIYAFNSLVLIDNGLDENKLQTKNFSVNESQSFNDVTKNWEKDGYIFNQEAILKIDNDNKLLTKIIKSISMLENSPSLTVSYGLKDDNNKILNLLIKEAYADAVSKANMIAKTTNSHITNTISVELQPINSALRTNFTNSNIEFSKLSDMDTSMITPEDIEVEINLLCIFEAINENLNHLNSSIM